MSNVDRHSGFKPREGANRARPYVAGGTVYPGDAVKLNASGQIVAGTAGAAMAGVAATYATSGNEVMVWDDPDQVYEIQDDGSATLATTSIGLNFDIVATAGSAAYIRSRMELAANSGATTPSTLPLRLLGVTREVGSDQSSIYQRCVVEINNHQLAKNTAGI